MVDFNKLRAEMADPGYKERREAEQRQWEADRQAQLAAIVARVRLVTEGDSAERAIAKLSDFDQRFIQSMARECDTWDLVTTLTGGKFLHLSDRQRQNFDRIMAHLERVLGIQAEPDRPDSATAHATPAAPAAASAGAPAAVEDSPDGADADDAASALSPLQQMLKRQRQR